MPRFDLAPKLQSRDGSLDKGGQIRNGFLEEKKGGGAWNWQRPALVPGFAAPYTGSGLGLYLVDTALWGLYHTGGTGGSISVRVGLTTNTSTTVTTFTLNAGTNASQSVGYIVPSTVGSLVPSTWSGAAVNEVRCGTDTSFIHTQLSVLGSFNQGYYKRLGIGVTTLYCASASTYGVIGGVTYWQWSGAAPMMTVGIYTGAFV